MAQLQFSDTTNKDGIVQKLQQACGLVSSSTNSYPLKQITKDVNTALDNFFEIARLNAPKIKIDDTNHSSEPAYTFNLVSGTQRYTYTVDASSNQITRVDRVDVVRADGSSKRLTFLNRETITEEGIASYKADAGEPEEYYIDGEEIVLFPKPNYNATNGGKLFIERAGSYFTSTDTTKVAGIPNLFHDYLWLRASYFWCLLKDQARARNLKVELMDMETRIAQYYKRLNADSTRTAGVQRLTPARQSNK
jgi:hypothetical protein